MTPANKGSNDKTSLAVVRRYIRPGNLMVVVGLQIIVLAWIISRDPMTSYRLHTALCSDGPQTTSQKSFNFDADPGVGADMRAISVEGQRLGKLVSHSKVGYLLISVGDCASCMGMDLKAVQRQAAAHGINTVLFTTAPPRNAQKFVHDGKLSIPIYSDESEKLSKGLNALWAGRCYLFSTNWRLVWLQKQRTLGYSPISDAGFNRILGDPAQ